jgi:hypothetical protein
MVDVEKIKALNNKFVFVKPLMIGGICRLDIDAGTCNIGDISIDVKSIKSVDGDIVIIGE